MIKIFTGDDRIRAKQAIEKYLGQNYEVIDCADLTPGDLPTIFFGTTLFADVRHILLRDFTANRQLYDHLPEYLNTPHQVALFETKLDKRATVYKQIKDQLEILNFPLAKNQDFRLVFDIYKVAKRDGKKAVTMLESIKQNEEPIMFTGLLISQALKDYNANPAGRRERNILKALAKLDLQQKTTGTDPWLLVESFLIRLSSL